MNDLWAVVLRPVALLVLLAAAFALSRLLERVIPDGRIKRILYARHEVVPPIETVSPRTRFVCTMILLLIALLIIFKPFRYL